MPSPAASSIGLPVVARDRRGDCGRHEVSQVPTRSLAARTGLRLRWSDGPSQNGPAHVACGGSQRLGLHGKSLSRLNTVLVVSLCTLQDHRRRRSRNTRYRAGATPYPDRTSTGWIAPASPGAREQTLRTAGFFEAVFDLDNTLTFVADTPAFWIRARRTTVPQCAKWRTLLLLKGPAN